MHRNLGRVDFFVFIFKDKRKHNGQDKRITGKNKPDTLPVLNATWAGEMVNYPTAGVTTDNCAKPIGHNHKQALGARPYFSTGFFLDKQ